MPVFTTPRLGARLVQQRSRLGSAFDRARLIPPGAVADLFGGQPRQQSVDHAAALFAQPQQGALGEQGLQGGLETDGARRPRVVSGSLQQHGAQ